MPDDRISALYGLPLERFTAERNALAAELRSEGDSGAAAEVKRLRKPSAAAWAVNQLVRAEPELVEALLGAGGELRQAHRQAASGKQSEQLRAAADAERAAIERLMQRAPAVLGRMVSGALADSIRNSLHAASSDDQARELVASGTLTQELRPVGLGPVPASLAISQTIRKAGEATHARDARDAKAASAERARELRAAKAETAALSRELDAATRALDRAEEAYARAREAADAAAERLKDVRRRVREARAGLREAERRRSSLERE